MSALIPTGIKGHERSQPWGKEMGSCPDKHSLWLNSRLIGNGWIRLNPSIPVAELHMSSIKALAPVRYSITRNDEGVTLCIWEPAKVTEVRVKPFLFKINHRLPSADEAQRVLSDYLENF